MWILGYEPNGAPNGRVATATVVALVSFNAGGGAGWQVKALLQGGHERIVSTGHANQAAADAAADALILP